jgi:hypothetical protein
MENLMPLVRAVHVGGIDRNRECVCTVVKGSRLGLVRELNNWLFDYFYAHGLPIQELPPLDDWNKSTEDSSYYYLAFPDIEWHVWLRTESIEF